MAKYVNDGCRQSSNVRNAMRDAIPKFMYGVPVKIMT